MKLYKLPTTTNLNYTVVLANGSFPSHQISFSILQNAKSIICCDGAINQLSAIDIVPQAIVGDCDSMSAENRLKYQSKIYHVDEQETNDLTKAIHYCTQKGIQNIIILGATGKREDHTIANISLLAEYVKLIPDICLVTDYGIFNAISENSKFESFKGQQVSIFSIENATITSIDLKYAIKNQKFTNWWQASLNEAINSSFEIETDKKILVFRSFLNKSKI